MRGLEELGRVRLSRFFFLRDFLYSEISNVHGIANIPSDPDLAVAAGTRLCEDLLDPLVETFGPIHVRSSYRSEEVNGYGNRHGENCASNEANRAGHIWDRRDADGHMGATACIVVPWFADRYATSDGGGRDLADLAWWVHDHLPYAAMEFFPKLAAFNLTWKEGAPGRKVSSYVAPRGTLIPAGGAPPEGPSRRRARHADFPPFRAIAYP